MGLTSLQVCVDSSDWLQGTMQDDHESGMDSSSSPSAVAAIGDMDMLTCSRPSLIERRLRPPHDQSLKCPRCDSTHTKFCYYNNYSLSQPRYFCKTCRRYWTKGGTLRNIPVGGGCRKNKKASSSSKKCSSSNENSPNISNNTHNPSDLHLSFPPTQEMQFSHINNFFGAHHLNNNFLDNSVRNYDFMGNINNGGEHIVDHHSFHGLCSPFGNMGMDHGNNNIVINNTSNGSASFVDSCQRLMLPYDHQDPQNNIGMDVKPKLLSLEWQDQQCSDTGKDSFGYLNAMGSWSGMMNGYGSSATNPLV